MSEFVTRKDIPLEPETGFYRPKEPPRLVYYDSPAISVMTDFKLVRPVTTRTDVSVDRALEGMKKAQVRLLLVIDRNEHVVGVITANDIMGEKPIRLTRDTGVPRAEMQVEMLMTPQQKITALNMMSVRDSQVGHIVSTLKALERQHILVVDIDNESSRQQIRGLFSMSQISRQLGKELTEDEHAAHSLAEIVHVIT